MSISVLQPLIPLHFLGQGQSAEIGQLMGEPELVHRLEELGLRQGQLVRMIRPGVPCIIQVQGNRYCFRGTETYGVLVRRRSERP
jgi:ferrous iron transport protein A